MPADRVYLDFNATAPLRPVARSRVIAALEAGGNASSIHAEGRRARASIEGARASVAGLVEVDPARVTFTSGATEAAALALTPDLFVAGTPAPAARLLVGATEHPAVAQGHRFPASAVRTVPVRPDGVIDLAVLDDLLSRGEGRSVLALQAANGETGVLQPVAAAADIVHRYGGLLVCDAVQAAGRIDCRAATLQADVILLSAHKLGGPQGVGAMVACRDALAVGTPLVRGGGQERGLRGGTENGPAIAGFGAVAAVLPEHAEGPRLLALRQAFEAALRALAPDAVIFGEGAARLPNTTAFAIPGIGNDALLIALDLAGFAVSTGSACSSGKVSRSHVLEAMGVDTHLSSGLIRVSLGWSSTPDHVVLFVGALDGILARRRGQERIRQEPLVPSRMGPSRTAA